MLKQIIIPLYFLAACGSATDAVSTKLGTGAARYTPAVDLEHFHFMLMHNLRLRGSSSIGLG
jgi:hypothetical protein